MIHVLSRTHVTTKSRYRELGLTWSRTQYVIATNSIRYCCDTYVIAVICVRSHTHVMTNFRYHELDVTWSQTQYKIAVIHMLSRTHVMTNSRYQELDWTWSQTQYVFLWYICHHELMFSRTHVIMNLIRIDHELDMLSLVIQRTSCMSVYWCVVVCMYVCNGQVRVHICIYMYVCIYMCLRIWY